MPSLEKEFKNFVKVIAKLRGKNGCPWDKEQTHKSLKPYMIEETYEAIEAIDKKNDKHLKEELGDMLLHILMHTEIAKERKAFTLFDVIKTIRKKIIHRHPHVFSNKKAKNIEDIWNLSEKAKAIEKKEYKSLMDGIPKTLPALHKAYKIQGRASRIGFDWPNHQGPLNKIIEEINELKAEIKNKNKLRIKYEIGDILFSTVNLSRKLKIDPENALRETISKFNKRFKFIEKWAYINRKKLNSLSLKEMDKLWEKSKINKGTKLKRRSSNYKKGRGLL